MIGHEHYRDREKDIGEGSGSSVGLMDIKGVEQAETYVHKLRNEFWANTLVVDIERNSDRYRLSRRRETANAYARMEIAWRLFDISPYLHPDYTPEQTQQANLAIELVIEAREKIVPPSKPPLGHLGSPQDLWADEQAEQLKQRRELEKQTGRGDNVIEFCPKPA